MRLFAVSRANSYNERCVARIRYGAHVRRPLARAFVATDDAVAAIAGRHHHADTGAHQSIDLDTESALTGCEKLRVERVSKAQVEPVNVKSAAVVVALMDVADRRKQITLITGF